MSISLYNLAIWLTFLCRASVSSIDFVVSLSLSSLCISYIAFYGLRSPTPPLHAALYTLHHCYARKKTLKPISARL